MDTTALGGSQGHIRIAEILLDNGADINAKTDGGWTPLHVAAYQDEKNIIPDLSNAALTSTPEQQRQNSYRNHSREKPRDNTQLVEHGADLEPVTATAWSPFRWASKNRQTGMNALSC